MRTKHTICIYLCGTFNLSNIIQIRGPVPLGGLICPTTRYLVDGGIQWSGDGVDVWKIPKPIYTRDWTKSFQNYPMNSDIAGVANLFVKNNSWRVSKKRRRFNLSSKDSIVPDFD